MTNSVAAERTQKLYDAAVQQFLSRGYYDVDVAHIAAAAGVSHGTFYNYYSNKRAVLHAIQQTTEDAMVKAFSGLRSASAPTTRDEFIDEFTARIGSGMTFMNRHAELMRFVAVTAVGVDADAMDKALVGYERLGGTITEFLAFGRERGWVHADIDLTLAGQAVISVVVTALQPVLLEEAVDFDAAAAAKVCATYLLSGLRRPKNSD
ncbi:TetR/AcrR family transcriptional regulator [Mycolicibacterium sphagni]|uniref:TetR/AcrR family transcriptional regulator n=1 Tax=Mycolicibacterium sphagni TaxID=1786 RepID=UPI0021F2F1EE|nr:TetR/AcrR family transcriptional regulator [Mycolicibacterium sphagni]MCV7178675.1 TetR/AcrR family transcriptional regulator [Mycolicibacterium sphagni]